jgi:antitoxin component YwqK of YwqJK toxin-antitoxin module
MKTNFILTGTLGMLLCLYAAGQTGLFQTDAVDIAGEFNNELIDNNSLPANGVINGFHSDGRIRYSATVKNSRLHGVWSSWYNNNTSHDEGRLVRGIPDGEWKVWYPNGKLRFVRTYSYEKLQRLRQEWTRPHPKMANYPLTNIYKNDRQKALSLVKSNYSFRNFTIDNSYTPVFKDCLHHGLYMNFYEDGSMKDSGYYKNGLRDGVWEEGLVDGSGWWIGNYQNGIKTGTWKRISHDKKTGEIVIYRNGKEDWRKVY